MLKTAANCTEIRSSVPSLRLLDNAVPDNEQGELSSPTSIRLETSAMDEMVALVLSLGFKTFALPDIAGCGPVLKYLHQQATVA